jgi:hypothetical protein
MTVCRKNEEALVNVVSSAGVDLLLKPSQLHNVLLS